MGVTLIMGATLHHGGAGQHYTMGGTFTLNHEGNTKSWGQHYIMEATLYHGGRAIPHLEGNITSWGRATIYHEGQHHIMGATLHHGGNTT